MNYIKIRLAQISTMLLDKVIGENILTMLGTRW